MAVIIAVTTLLAGITIVAIAGLLDMELWLRILLTVFGLVIIIVGIALACVLERDAGVYECKYCGERFVPTITEYIFAAHLLTKRHLKCPHCGKRSYCKKRLTKQ